MLVLSRKLGQRVLVGDDVRITVVKIDKNSIRIGIEAPDDVKIHREEVAVADRQRRAEFAIEVDLTDALLGMEVAAC